MIFEIEMLIHTRYIVTDNGKLQIETGRFVADKTILLNDIKDLRKIKSFSVAPALSVDRIEIVYHNNDKVEKICISPQNASEFLRWIEKKRKIEE